MGDDVLLRRPRALAQDDDRLDRLAPALVGHGDHRAIGDRGMSEQRVLNLGRIDVLGAGDDHVLDPVDDVDIAVGVHPASISGVHPTAA
jgi:hypothetical protein